jgi:manganese/zinc/iron transport system permease protein
MTQAQLEIQLIAAVVAAACALPGVFLVLRRMAMMSDAISHTVLLGIVLAFFVVEQFGHPLLVIGATAVGVLTVSLTELLNKTRLVKEDAAIGLVFPALFSIAVILISVFARNVHLDTHVVFQGDLAFAPFDRFLLFGMDVMPRTLAVMLGILLLNFLFILLFYKELKLATFDAGLAAALGFSPALIHYGLMTLVSVTAVGAFDAVGSILVIALMIVPAATAYLLTDRLPTMLGLSVLIGVAGAVSGYWLARWLDSTIGGSMVTMLGVIFGLVFLLAPERGLVALAQRRRRQKWEFAETMLAIHLTNHEGKPEYAEESRVDHLIYHLNWQPSFVTEVVRRAEQDKLIERQNGNLVLTENGRKLANEAIMR